MSLFDTQRKKIKKLLTDKIEKKLKTYDRETTSMPFLARIIQDNEKVAAYSFMHSITTMLGMSIYENVSVIIASEHCEECYRKYGVGGVISKQQKNIISKIVRELRNKERIANIEKEKQEILSASSQSAKFQKSGNVADFYMKQNGKEHYFEIKTVKPNIDIFEKNKAKLLEWIARKRKDINVYLVFPYNPYHPEPYSRFTEVGLMDHPNDFLIGEEYWDFIGGEGTFKDLLAVFDDVGNSYKDKLDQKFKQIAKEKINSY